MGGSSAPETPESEKEAKRNAAKMVNIGGGLQSQVYDGFNKALARESGHREAGDASASLASMSEKQLKGIQADPVAVANHATDLAAGLDSTTFTAKGTAAINDTSREMMGAKSGVASQMKNVDGQTQLATIANRAALAKAQQAEDRNQQLLNLAGAAAGYGVGKYQDYSAAQKQKEADAVKNKALVSAANYWYQPVQQDRAP